MADEILDDGSGLGTPVIELRWRLQNRKLHLPQRHLRMLPALGFSEALAAWVQQHVEWTIEKTPDDPDGVLITALYGSGEALMRIEPYAEPQEMTADEMVASFSPAQEDGVADTVLWVAEGDRIIVVDEPDRMRSAVNSLMMDLARTTGASVEVVPALPEDFDTTDESVEVFYVSDEHGVVGSVDRSGSVVERLVSYYQKSLDTLNA